LEIFSSPARKLISAEFAFPLNSWRWQFDFNHTAMLADGLGDPGIWNDVNSQRSH
jgi:hypothetical protein